MENEELRDISWIGSSLEDLKSFPKVVQKDIGFTLYRIQEGKMSPNVKQLNRKILGAIYG